MQETFEDIGANYEFTFSTQTLEELTQPVTSTCGESTEFELLNGPVVTVGHLVHQVKSSVSNQGPLIMDNSGLEYQILHPHSPTTNSTFLFSSPPSLLGLPIMPTKPMQSATHMEVDKYQNLLTPDTVALSPESCFPFSYSYGH